ncbi:MAG: chitobiase/beta-hexosaminidase C-terminal domain-containing protein [Christensenellaceae bacterium]|nr:chitobiase/beta-hexosaminidase C-terminal domain-containing protein [Christensenellaceae bacterium]
MKHHSKKIAFLLALLTVFTCFLPSVLATEADASADAKIVDPTVTLSEATSTASDPVTITLPTVAKVSSSMEAGTYYKNIRVALSCDSADAVIRYTTNGKTPTTRSKVYQESFKLTESTTVKAVAFVGDVKGEVSTYKYEIIKEYPTKIKLNAKTLSLKMGEKFKIKTTFTPSTAYYKDLTYSVNNKAICTVSSSGTITAKKGGTTTVYVKTENGLKASIKVTVVDPRITHVTYNQGDNRWGFSRSTELNACYLASYAMLIRNLGIEDANPKTVYAANGRRTAIKPDKVNEKFGVKKECALASGSKYLDYYDKETGKTYLKNPGKGTRAYWAIREALNRNPEGILIYHKEGNDAHAIVAVDYDADRVYYCDPGRTRGHYITFKNTWTYYRHRMTHEDIAWIVALDRK